MSSKAVKKTKVVAKTKDACSVKPVKSVKPKDTTKGRDRRLSDKEFRELEHSVYSEVAEFEGMMFGVLNRHAWAALLKDAVKHHCNALTDEQKTKLEHIIKAYDDVCEGDAIVMTLKVFSEEACRRRRAFAFEDALREAGGKSTKSQAGKCRSRTTGKVDSHPKARVRK